MSFCLIFNSAFINLAKANLSLVTPDGSTNTTIDTTPNNITIINIADSNSNGVSMNNFNQYNVDPTGLIINNSNINYDTNLAGWISANTHISNGSNRQASLIIEQVTGNLPSYLFGYTEIAGGKADLVLLNPNGMTCNGCGFININSMFLGTGTASYQSGMLSGINTNTNNNANISINGLGLNGTSLNSLSLISKQINLNATTNLGNTGTLILQQGTGNFNFTNQNFTTASTTQSSNIAIDASSLGSMYAGQIFIIANDLGVGVHLHADVIAQQQGITILDNGDLVYSKTIASHTNVNITANTLTNEKNSILFSQNNTTINADNITNLSLILAKHNLNINATTLNNGSTVQAAYITAGNDMQIIASQINNIGQDNGLLTENNAYTITTQAVGANLYVNSPPQITSQEVTTNLLTSSNSRIIANNNLIIQGNVFNQTGDILSGNNLTIIGNVTNNITHFTTRQLATGWTWRHLDCNFFCPVQWDYWNTYSTQTLSSTTPTRIAAAQTLTITGNQISNDSGNATFNNNAPLTNNISSNPNNNYASTFNNATNLNLTNLNSPVLDLSSLANTGMFINNANPPQLTTTNLSGTVINFTYPIETNPIFTNPNTFLSSSYFLQHLNFSPSRQIMLVGDPTYERQLIHDTIAKAGMTQYLSNSSEDALYQNGLTWLQNNLSTSNGGNGSSSSTYNFGDALTPDQINSLTTDIIIPVYQTQTTTNPITHQTTTKQILTPQIYFCNNTLSSNKQQTTTGGQIYSNTAGVTLIATNSTTTNLNGTTTTIPANITNSGYIAANNTVNIISQNSFTNNGGTINSNNGDININAKSVLITNQTQTSSITEGYNMAELPFLGSNRFDNSNNLGIILGNKAGTSSQIQNVSKLTSQNGNIDITSNSDLNIQGASIDSGHNTTLTSTTGLVNIETQSSTSSISHHSSTSSLTGLVSQSSDFSASNTQSVSTDINTGGSLTINADRDINIISGKNIVNQSYTQSNAIAMFWNNSHSQMNSNQTNVANNLTSNGTITLNANNNITAVGSSLNSTNGDIDINNQGILALLSNQLLNKSSSSKSISDLFGSMASGNSTENVTNAFTILNAENININNINSLGSSNTTSNGVLIRGANLTSQNNTKINSTGNISIADVKNITNTSSYHQTQKNALTTFIVDCFINPIYAFIDTFVTANMKATVAESYTENILSSNITSGNDLTINSNGNNTNINIQSSNLISNNIMNLTATGALNIVADYENNKYINKSITGYTDFGAFMENMIIQPVVGAATGMATGFVAGGAIGGPMGALAEATEGLEAGFISGLIGGMLDGLNEDNISTKTTKTDTKTNISSNLKTTGSSSNIILSSNTANTSSDNSINLIASNIATPNTVTINTNGSVFNALSLQNTSQTTTTYEYKTPDYNKVAQNAATQGAINGAIAGFTAGIANYLAMPAEMAKKGKQMMQGVMAELDSMKSLGKTVKDIAKDIQSAIKYAEKYEGLTKDIPYLSAGLKYGGIPITEAFTFRPSVEGIGQLIDQTGTKNLLKLAEMNTYQNNSYTSSDSTNSTTNSSINASNLIIR